MNEEIALAYRNAPTGVKVGRVIMWIGCILFFFAGIGDIVSFFVAVANPELMEVDWSVPIQAVQIGSLPFLGLFLIFGGIGGICFILDKGKLKSMATLIAVVMLIVILIDTALSVRRLVYDWMGSGAGKAWFTLFMNFLDIQLSGGIYVIGWFLCKDFVGD